MDYMLLTLLWLGDKILLPLVLNEMPVLLESRARFLAAQYLPLLPSEAMRKKHTARLNTLLSSKCSSWYKLWRAWQFAKTVRVYRKTLRQLSF